MVGINWNDYFYYDENCASFLRWKVEIRRGKGREVVCVSPGDLAGYLDNCGYWVVGLHGKIYKVHRVIWQLFNGPLEDGDVVDHEDRNKENNRITNFRLIDNPLNRRNMTMNVTNTSGVTGVSLKESHGYSGWRAKWHELDGKRHEKHFSIIKLGNEEAFRLACEYREKMIAQLNEQGAGYTATHGKR